MTEPRPISSTPAGADSRLDTLTEELDWSLLNIRHFTIEVEKAYQRYATLKEVLSGFRARHKAADKALAALDGRTKTLPRGAASGAPKTTAEALAEVPDELLALFDDPAKLAQFKALLNKAEEKKKAEGLSEPAGQTAIAKAFAQAKAIVEDKEGDPTL